jgi:hypothetical protein
MQLLLYAILIFLVSAVGGLFMAYKILNGQLAPWLVSLVHLLLGATGLVLVLLAVAAGAGGVIGYIALVILLVAALGGFLLAAMHLRKKIAPPGLVILHAALGVTGVLLLLGVVFLFGTLTEFAKPGETYGSLQLALTMLA